MTPKSVFSKNTSVVLVTLCLYSQNILTNIWKWDFKLPSLLHQLMTVTLNTQLLCLYVIRQNRTWVLIDTVFSINGTFVLTGWETFSGIIAQQPVTFAECLTEWMWGTLVRWFLHRGHLYSLQSKARLRKCTRILSTMQLRRNTTRKQRFFCGVASPPLQTGGISMG